MKERTCCFAGHRGLMSRQISTYMPRLNDEVERLMGLGVTTFISGDELGFDQMAASLIVAKRDAGCPVHLILVLPCRARAQSADWSSLDWRRQQRLRSTADVVAYRSGDCDYGEGCVNGRNSFMVDQSAYCICAMLYERSGTGQIVRYARQKGLCVINIAMP